MSGYTIGGAAQDEVRALREKLREAVEIIAGKDEELRELRLELWRKQMALDHAAEKVGELRRLVVESRLTIQWQRAAIRLLEGRDRLADS